MQTGNSRLNLSPDPDNAYFADGLSEELTDALTRIRELNVASHTSAFFFKEKQQDVREIAAKLGVNTLIEGSVRKTAGRLIITTVQLVRADNGYPIWSQKFERESTDVFAVQQQIAESIVTSLRLTLSPEQGSRLKRQPRQNLEAVDRYPKGRHLASGSFSLDTLQRATGLFNQSIALDPNYALEVRRPQTRTRLPKPGSLAVHFMGVSSLSLIRLKSTATNRPRSGRASLPPQWRS